LNETISDLPKLYSKTKDTVTAENLIDLINASVYALGWTLAMVFNYFRMALHSNTKDWIKLVCETEVQFEATWDFIKPLFKTRFRKKMEVAKGGTVLVQHCWTILRWIQPNW
jgi:hypothetical protein